MRYLLFGVWLALLLAVGLAWMHERYSLASLPYTGQTKVRGSYQQLGAYEFLVWGYDADIFSRPNPDLIGPAVAGLTVHTYFCKGICTPLATTWTNAEGNWVDAETGKPLVPTQNVQVNNGLMIQVNQ